LGKEPAEAKVLLTASLGNEGTAKKEGRQEQTKMHHHKRQDRQGKFIGRKKTG